MTSYRFLRWWPLWRNFTSVSDWATSLSSEGQCLSAYHIVKITQSMAEMYLFPFCKNKRPPYWNSTSGLDIDRFVVICMFFLHQAIEFRPSRSTRCENMTSYPFLKMAAMTAKYCFRFRICWCHCLRKVNVYQPTKFRRHTSIHGWDITTSVLEKQTSAILEFYFRFRSRPFCRNRCVILHPAAEFRPNRSTHCGNMRSYSFI